MVPRYTGKRLSLAALILLAFFLSACGQKGPLKLPAPEPTELPPGTPSQESLRQ